MKTGNWYFLLACGLASLQFGAVAHGSLQPGQAAPAFTLQDAQGKTHSLADYRGKTVVLEWFNHSCPFVKKHYRSGNMPNLQKEWTGKGVVWLSINSSNPASGDFRDPAATLKLNAEVGGAQTAILLDPEGKVGRAYGAKTTPHCYVIDGNGNLVYQGAIDSIASADAADIGKATNYVAEALRAVQAGKPVSVADTRPYGCNVKY